MPTRKLPDTEILPMPLPQCRHPDHDPPTHRVFEPGTYEHTCPACGRIVIFTVPPACATCGSLGQWRFVP